MPTREELEDEDRRVRQLRIAVSLALNVIGQTEMSVAQAQELVSATRGMALRLFPGKEHRAGPGGLLMIPAGTPHHVANSGKLPVFFVTVYAPPAY